MATDFGTDNAERTFAEGNRMQLDNIGRQSKHYGEFGSCITDTINKLSTSVSGDSRWSAGWSGAECWRRLACAVLVTLVLLASVRMLIGTHTHDYTCTKNDNVSCHFKRTEEDLPPFTDLASGIDLIAMLTHARSRWGNATIPSTTGKNIFFIHASCEEDLTPVQACAVETAAQLHRGWNVYVLFAGPVSLQRAVSGLLANISLPNVRFARIRKLEFLWKTPYFDIDSRLAARKKSYTTSTTILRFTTLLKHDGVVLDINRILSGPLDWLGENFVSINDGLTSDAMGLQRLVRKDFSKDLFREVDRQSRFNQRQCASFTGAEALAAIMGNMEGYRTGSIKNSIRLRDERKSQRIRVLPLGIIFKPPTAEPTQEDCPNVFAYTSSKAIGGYHPTSLITHQQSLL